MEIWTLSKSNLIPSVFTCYGFSVNILFLTESQNEYMNLVISGVTSTAPGFQDNNSDDDVIEVIKDDGPIVILSDSEEPELNQKESQMQPSVIQNFHFTSVSTAENITDENRSVVLEDPLKEDALNNTQASNTSKPPSAVPYSVIALPPPSDKTKSAEVTRNSTDSNNENSTLNDTGDTTTNRVENPTKDIAGSDPMEVIEQVLNENGASEMIPDNIAKVAEDNTKPTSTDKTE